MDRRTLLLICLMSCLAHGADVNTCAAFPGKSGSKYSTEFAEFMDSTYEFYEVGQNSETSEICLFRFKDFTSSLRATPPEIFQKCQGRSHSPLTTNVLSMSILVFEESSMMALYRPHSEFPDGGYNCVVMKRPNESDTIAVPEGSATIANGKADIIVEKDGPIYLLSKRVALHGLTNSNGKPTCKGGRLSNDWVLEESKFDRIQQKKLKLAGNGQKVGYTMFGDHAIDSPRAQFAYDENCKITINEFNGRVVAFALKLSTREAQMQILREVEENEQKSQFLEYITRVLNCEWVGTETQWYYFWACPRVPVAAYRHLYAAVYRIQRFSAQPLT